MRKPAQKTVKPDISKPELNTVEWLRTFNGFQQYSDQETTDVLQTLNMLSSLLFDVNSNQSFSDVTDNNISNRAA